MDASPATFTVAFTAEGAAKLRDRIKQKLKELARDYTDDTLVDYVMVLIRSGRCKEEAKKELDVFLGDGSELFSSWLWDHLAESLHLCEKVAGGGGMEEKGKHVPLEDTTALGNSKALSEEEHPKPRTRRNRGWRGLVEADVEPIILRVEDPPVDQTGGDATEATADSEPLPSDEQHSIPPTRPNKRWKGSTGEDAEALALQVKDEKTAEEMENRTSIRGDGSGSSQSLPGEECSRPRSCRHDRGWKGLVDDVVMPLILRVDEDGRVEVGHPIQKKRKFSG